MFCLLTFSLVCSDLSVFCQEHLLFLSTAVVTLVFLLLDIRVVLLIVEGVLHGNIEQAFISIFFISTLCLGLKFEVPTVLRIQNAVHHHLLNLYTYNS